MEFKWTVKDCFGFYAGFNHLSYLIFFFKHAPQDSDISVYYKNELVVNNIPFTNGVNDKDFYQKIFDFAVTVGEDRKFIHDIVNIK